MTSEQLFTVLLAAASAVLAAQLSVRGAIRQHRAERWWERKERAYAEIIEALYNVVRDHEVALREHDAQRVLYSEERGKQISDAGREGMWTIKRATAMGNYIVADEVAAALVELDRATDAVDSIERDFGSIYSEELELYKLSLELIRNLARADLMRAQA